MKANALILALAIASVSTLGFFAYVMMSQPEPVKPAAITTPEELPLTRENLLKLVNEERAKVGVAPLVIDERLNQSAQMKADDMALYGYFGHTNHDGTKGADLIFKTARDVCSSGGENLTWDKSSTGVTAQGSIDSWVGSKPHYSAIIDSSNQLTGFGIVDNAVVQHLCKPL